MLFLKAQKQVLQAFCLFLACICLYHLLLSWPGSTSTFIMIRFTYNPGRNILKLRNILEKCGFNRSGASYLFGITNLV